MLAIQRYLENGFVATDIEAAVNILKNTDGTVVVTGMGKSGNIAAKLASTLTSTGTPAVFLHPGEALHGGLGLIRARDVVIAISKSGETSELRDMLPAIKLKGTPMIAITCKRESSIASYATAVISYDTTECCGQDLVPTSSSTMALIIGDSIAMALMKTKRFKVEHFASSHPGGTLGTTLQGRIGEFQSS